MRNNDVLVAGSGFRQHSLPQHTLFHAGQDFQNTTSAHKRSRLQNSIELHLLEEAANVKKHGARFGPGLNLSGDHLPEFIAILLPTALISHRNTRHVGIHRSRTPPIYTPQDLLYNPSTSNIEKQLTPYMPKPPGVVSLSRLALPWLTDVSCTGLRNFKTSCHII